MAKWTKMVHWKALMEAGMKHCNDCQKVKSLSEFSSYMQNGYRRYRSCCKGCATARTMKWIAATAAVALLTLVGGCAPTYSTIHGYELTKQACEEGNEFSCAELPQKEAEVRAIAGNIAIGSGTHSHTISTSEGTFSICCGPHMSRHGF